MPVLSRNAVLKGEFRVGARLGEGACAEVYCCERVQGAKLSRAQKLQQSDADLVVKAAPIPPQSKKKAKDYMDKKRAADTLFAEHLLYANVLNRHPRRFGTKVGYGEDQNCRYLVLERLGPSLGDEMAETRLTPQQLASIGADCLASLEVLHAQKYVYCDMKPENIMLGTCSSGRIRDKDQARLVDFGVATRYVSAVSGKHKAEDEGGGQAGTPRFASLASSSSPPARRDDVEALAYVLVYFSRGSLPWQGLKAATKKQKYERISEKKIATPVDTLCRGLPAGVALQAVAVDLQAVAAALQAVVAALQAVGLGMGLQG